MRTKTLLLAAVLGVATVATSLAQTVYSVNVVGYVNVPLVQGLNLIANPLDNQAANGNTVGILFAGVPEGTTIFKFSAASGTYSANGFEFGEWANPSQTLEPGEGAFVSVPSAVTVTFVGEVRQGTLTTPIIQGLQIVSSQVPQAGGIQTVLGYPPADGDTVYVWNQTTQGYSTLGYEFGEWSAEPNLDVGEAVFLSASSAKSWTRTFTVQ
jgi:hypothetical protein